jgi:hypothetical protein
MQWPSMFSSSWGIEQVSFSALPAQASTASGGGA